MKKTTYQVPEIRDENDNIVQEGTFGKKSAFVNSTNQGAFDYILNDLEALHDIATGAYLIFDSKDKFPSAGDTAKIYVSNADGKAYKWNGTEYVYMGTESTQFTALDVKKMKEAAADSAKAAADSAADAGASASSASASATDAEASRQAAKQSAQNCSDLYAKTLNQYVLTSLQGNNDVKAYNRIRNFYFLARGADKLKGTTTDTDATTLTGIVTDWYKLTRNLVKDFDGYVRFPHPDVSSQSTGTKYGSLAGMLCEISTETVKGRNDYEGHPLFATTYCNWKMASNNPVITAVEGVSPDFSFDDKSKLLGVLQMSAWIYGTDIDASSDHYDIGYEATIHAHTNEEPLPEAKLTDGTVREWVLHGACACSLADDGKSYYMCYGQEPSWTGMSHNNMKTITDLMGNGISTSTSVDDSFIKRMCYMLFGSMTLDDTMIGNVNYWADSIAQVAETGVKRVIIPAADINKFPIGSYVVIDAWDGTTTDTWSLRNKSTKSITGKVGVKVLDSKKVTINGTDYTALYVDTPSTFDTSVTTGSQTRVYSWIYHTGSTRNILGNTGSVNPTDGNHVIKVQGIEFSWGQYEALSDVILELTKDGDNYYYQPYVCKPYAKRSTSKTDDYEACDVKLQGTESWQYIKHEKYSKGFFFPDIVGGSSSTYTKDAIYTNKNTGEREVLLFGYLCRGSGDGGLSCLYGNGGLGDSTFYYGSRLSPNGTRG